MESNANTSEWNVDVTKIGEIKYDVCKDNVEVIEKLYWFERPKDCKIPVYDLNTLLSWRKTSSVVSSKAKPIITEASQDFINRNLFSQLHSCKVELKNYSTEQLQAARLRSNAFENIREGGIFINRAAMKMANLDAILNFQMTNPNSAIETNSKLFVEKTEPLYFADICAGPGGFSEYLLWRKRFTCMGFGLTLKGDYDFNLSSFVTPTENFTAFYGDADDGDIQNPLNVSSFLNFVYRNTDQKGVHIVTGDGGIDFGGQEEFQEVLTKKILLAQILVGISILRPGGHFICKTFDLFTPFSVGLVYLLSTCFRKLSIHKPNTSRPANSERYLICQFKHEYSLSVQEYLRNCHEFLWKNKSFGPDIEELVPLKEFKNDSKFLDYICNSNNRLAIRQIFGLQKLLAFAKDNSLFDPRKEEVCQKSLEIWHVSAPETQDSEEYKNRVRFPKDRLPEIKGNFGANIMNKPETELSSTETLHRIKSPFDWRIVAVGGNVKKRGYYFGFGGGRNYFLYNHIWREIQIKFNLPRDTIVYAELVEELLPNAVKSSAGLHIIDALILGGQDVRNLHFNQRNSLCSLFVKTLGKTKDGMIPIRTKRLFKLENLDEYYKSLVNKEGLPNQSSCLFTSNNTTDQVSVKPHGLLFLKITADPWMMAFCKRADSKYWFHTIEKTSTFQMPPTAVADFNCTAINKMIWALPSLGSLGEGEDAKKKETPEVSYLTKEEVDNYIQSLLRTTTTA